MICQCVLSVFWLLVSLVGIVSLLDALLSVCWLFSCMGIGAGDIAFFCFVCETSIQIQSPFPHPHPLLETYGAFPFFNRDVVSNRFTAVEGTCPEGRHAPHGRSAGSDFAQHVGVCVGYVECLSFYTLSSNLCFFISFL